MDPMDVWIVTVVALHAKMFALPIVQAVFRMRSQVFVVPEDAAVWGTGEVSTEEHPMVARAQRAIGNDLENIPMFLFLSYAYVASGAWPTGAYIYLPLFVVSRAVHTMAYLGGVQPLRNRAFSVGVLTGFVMAIHLVVEVMT